MNHVMLTDGRGLDMRVTGPEDGPVLVFHVGTPMAATRLRFVEEPAHRLGLRVVTMSRPGYGDSTRLAGRSVVDVVADTSAVLDSLGVDRCAVAGYSGGGPHALACAARLDAAQAVSVVASVAPYADDLDWTAGMGEDNVNGFTAAAEGEHALRPLLEEDPEAFDGATVEQMIENLDSLLPDADRALLTDDLGEDLLHSMQEGYRSGVDGSLDDSLAFVKPWGFDLDEVTVPVMLWQGTEDLMVPYAHGEWLARRLPGVVAHLQLGDGHVSLLVGAMDKVLGDLVAAAQLT